MPTAYHRLSKSSVPVEVIFQELSGTWWHVFWWRGVLDFWNAMAQADLTSIINIVLHDAIAIAQNGCSYGWAAQVFRCFAEHGRSTPLVAGAPVEVQPDELLLAFEAQRQAAFDAVPLDPLSCPGSGLKLCTYRTRTLLRTLNYWPARQKNYFLNCAQP